MPKWLPILVGCLSASPAKGAETVAADDAQYVVSAWDIGEGLPDSTVTAILQAPDGYLWFGTFNGLVRFDGQKFKVFKPADTPELPSAGIVNLHQDRRGRFWVSTLEGLVMRDGMRWRALGTNEGWAGNYVRTFAERDNGDLLMTTFDGHVLAFEKDRLTELPPPPGERGHGYLGAVDENGQWWLTQSRYVGRWDGERWIQAHTPDPSLDRSSTAITPARSGGVWVLLGQELFNFRNGREISRRLLPTLRGGKWSMFEDSQSQLWICSYDSGMFQLTPEGELCHWTAAGGLDYPSARVVFEDQEGNLWVGTNGGGLRQLRTRRFLDVGEGSLLAKRVVRSVSPASDGGMWIATFDLGLFRHDSTGVTRVPVPGPRMEGLYGLSVLEDRAGRLWYGDSGQCWWRQGQGKFEIAPLNLPGSSDVGALFEDSQGRVWIAAGDTVVLYDGQGFQSLGPQVGMSPMEILCFAEDTSGRIWLAGPQGVFRHEQDRCTEIRRADRPLRTVLCLKAGPGDTMWMGTLSDGLLRWRNGNLDRVGRDLGLPAGEIRGIIEDDLGFFWMPSDRGIIRVHGDQLHEAADGARRSLDCHLLDQADGLPSASCPVGQPSCARDASGRLWFATQRGLALLDPTRFRINSHPPPVQVERLSYRAAKITSRHGEDQTGTATSSVEHRFVAPFQEPLQLPAGTHSVEIEYTALSYAAPDKVRFQFKLEGIDQHWEEAQELRFVRFPQLQPNRYVFRVRAANNDGIWNESGASLAFTVLPHYWQTWWFRIVTTVLLIGLGSAAAWWQSRTRVRRVLERERAANEIRKLAGRLINAQEDERRRIARELHDDFSQRLALLSVEMELLDTAATPESASAPRLSEMATRVKELSSEVHRMAYELHPAKLDQLGLVAAARSFCRDLSKTSDVRIAFEPGTCPRDVPPDLALCLYRILQESLQNVVHHSGSRDARVELSAESNRLCLAITDSGNGFDVDKARRENGLGLSSMQERVRLVHGTLQVTSEPGRGTRVEVCAPLHGV